PAAAVADRYGRLQRAAAVAARYGRLQRAAEELVVTAERHVPSTLRDVPSAVRGNLPRRHAACQDDAVSRSWTRTGRPSAAAAPRPATNGSGSMNTRRHRVR